MGLSERTQRLNALWFRKSTRATSYRGYWISACRPDNRTTDSDLRSIGCKLAGDNSLTLTTQSRILFDDLWVRRSARLHPHTFPAAEIPCREVE